ncbi:MAG: hypothetical protein COB09_16975 [Thalassobium sp.]|nr:MAG: hypothetical protein COB09_16975 [Thalassobium sp.]
MSKQSSVDNISKGPWHVEYELDDDHVRNGIVFVCNPETECDQTVIATLSKFDATDEEQKANAYLMASAPETYALLMEMNLYFHEGYTPANKYEQGLRDRVKAAMAKAKGKSS